MITNVEHLAILCIVLLASCAVVLHTMVDVWW